MAWDVIQALQLRAHAAIPERVVHALLAQNHACLGFETIKRQLLIRIIRIGRMTPRTDQSPRARRRELWNYFGGFGRIREIRMSSCCLLVLLVASTASAQGRPLKLEDYYSLKTIGAVQISPDGRWVTYTVSRRIEETNGDSSEVWVVATDGGSQPKRVSAAGTHATAPAWQNDELIFAAIGRRWSVRPERPESLTAAYGATQSARSQRRVTTADGRTSVVLRNVTSAPRAIDSVSEFARRHQLRFRGRQFHWLDLQGDGQPYPVP